MTCHPQLNLDVWLRVKADFEWRDPRVVKLIVAECNFALFGAFEEIEIEVNEFMPENTLVGVNRAGYGVAIGSIVEKDGKFDHVVLRELV